MRDTVVGACPPFDAREQAFGARTIGSDGVAVAIRCLLVRAGLGVEHAHEVFGAGKNEDVGFRGIIESGQPLVGAACDGGRPQAPADPEGAVAGPGIVGKSELRPEPRATGTGRNGDRKRAGPGDRVRGEFFADAANGAATFGRRNLRSEERRTFRTAACRSWFGQNRDFRHNTGPKH